MRDTTEFIAEEILTFNSVEYNPLQDYLVLEPSAGIGFLANYIKYFFNERIMQSIKKILIIDLSLKIIINLSINLFS